MSLIPTGVGLIEAGLQSLLQTAFFQSRSIGGFTADVTIEEQHTDELRITDHPVERNAVISDHAFKLPMRVTIRVGYSNSSFQAAGDPTYVNDVYNQFLAMQESRDLIYILTAKRLYQNMLIERLSTTTDEKTENSMFLVCECREIIIVDTQVSQLAPPQNQSQPGVTNGIQNNGAAATVPTSSLNTTAADATLATAPSPGGFLPADTSVGTQGTQSFSGNVVEIPIQPGIQNTSPYSLSQALP